MDLIGMLLLIIEWVFIFIALISLFGIVLSIIKPDLGCPFIKESDLSERRKHGLIAMYG